MRVVLLCTGLLLVVACARTEAPAKPVVAEASVVAAPAPQLQRWPTDAPLRAGMARIRIATGALAHAEHGHLDSAQVRALADELHAAVNAMIAQCKLEPAADAALHPLLARVLQASQALRQAPEDPAPLGELQEVLRRYPQLFDDPDWLRSAASPAPTS